MSEKGKAKKSRKEKPPELESLLKVSQISKMTGVSTSAINYYVRIGLLPPPIKTFKNMAYYDPSYVQMINYIKRLQLQKHLPLEQIKEIMAKKIAVWREMGINRQRKAETLFEDYIAHGQVDMDARARIMEAGMRLFSQRGYNACSEKDIVDLAQVSMGEFYEHYVSKEDLLLDLAEEGVRNFRSRVSEEIASVPDMLERIRISIPVAFQMIVENREILSLYLEGTILADISYERKVAQLTASIAKDLKATISRGVKDGSIRKVNPDIAANAILGQLVRLSNYWIEDAMKHKQEEITREAIEFVTRALRP